MCSVEIQVIKCLSYFIGGIVFVKDYYDDRLKTNSTDKIGVRERKRMRLGMDWVGMVLALIFNHWFIV